MPINKSGIFPVVLAFILFSARLTAQTPEVKIDGHYSGPAINVFKQLEQEYQVKFFYKDEWFTNEQLNVTFRDNTPEEAANMLIEGKGYTFRIIDHTNIVFLPRADVAILLGQIPNFSDAGEEDKFTQVGDLSEAGKQRNAVVTGKVTDGGTGEPIIGATIQIQNTRQGAVSNVQGNYRLIMPSGHYTLIVSSVGYETSNFNIRVVSSGNYDIELFDKSVRFEDVVIYGQRLDNNVTSHQMGLVELNMREMAELPSISGGKDVIKGLTIIPGIKSIGEFSSGINVRGGGEDQNLYLLNSAPLFYTTHVFGLVSAVNPETVEQLSLYKGHIPATFGERVSSVIDIRTNETCPAKFQLKGGAGIYDSRLMLAMPLIRNKIWFDIGGRTSYSDWILKNMKEFDLRNSRAGFYDFNGAIHASLGKHRFQASGYASHDYFRFSHDVRYSYGSRATSLNWNYLIGSNLASYFSLVYSDYNVSKDDIGDEQTRLKSGLQYSALKYRIQYGGIRGHNIETGINLVNYLIMPGKTEQLVPDVIVVPARLPDESGYEGAVFLNDEYMVNSRVFLDLGIRYSAYAKVGPGITRLYIPGSPKDTSTLTGYNEYNRGEIMQFYHGFEPRIAVRYKLNEVSSLKAIYNRNIQYISMISNSNVSTPSDLWKLADRHIKPLTADEFAIGYYRNFVNNTIEFSAEAYYKGLKNVIDYADDAELEMNSHIETEIVNATGRNYGIEFLLKKNAGRFDGWLTYTWSRSLRKTNGLTSYEIINNNQYYPSSYDRPHDFNFIGNFNLNRRVKFSANFSYASGRPITLPEYYFFNGTDEVPIFSDRNKYRIEPYHRLDVTLTISESLRLKKKWKSSWTFSVLNVYGRKNPYTIYFKTEEPNELNNFERFSLYKLYLIGRPVPSVTYNFVF